MNSNNVILVQQLLSQRKTELAPEMSDADFFEVFAAEQALKDYDLSYEELMDGIVDGRGDGGIDSIYFFIDNTLYYEEINPAEVKHSVPLELVFIQSKISKGFSETSMERFMSSARDLLDLNQDLSTLNAVYKADLLGKIQEFKETYLALISKFPKLSIRYYYAALASEVHPNVERKVEPLRDITQNFFSHVEFSFSFLHAGALLELSRRSPVSAHHLKLAENPISTGQKGFVCLVTLPDYCDFIRKEDGSLNEAIFEGNVRDYQGATEVNQQIKRTLASPTGEDFWWLNNGISVICASATLSGKILTIENAEVVNGLQTSREIFEVFGHRPDSNDTRTVLVRVLVPQQEVSRDRIIKATNSQTAIPSASLRATDKIHRDIEDFLISRGIYYDRRKNFYKNQGKPVKKIISIPYLAQAVLACALHGPADARARPSSLLKNDETYGRIFSETYPLPLYFKCVFLARRVEDVLRSDTCSVDRAHWNNLRFYVAMLVTTRLTGVRLHSVRQVAEIDLDQATDDLILECVNDVWAHYRKLGGTDKVAKGTDLVKKVSQTYEAFLRTTR